jgi:uncharacterized protein (TIGR00369 family)
MPSGSFDYLVAHMALSPFHRWLKPEIVSSDETTGEVLMRLPLRDEFRREPDRPILHGGVVAALADTSAYAAIAARVRHGVPAIDMRVDYLRAAAGEFLMASSIVVKFGRTIAIADARITDDAGHLVAIARGAYSTRADSRHVSPP